MNRRGFVQATLAAVAAGAGVAALQDTKGKQQVWYIIDPFGIDGGAGIHVSGRVVGETVEEAILQVEPDGAKLFLVPFPKAPGVWFLNLKFDGSESYAPYSWLIVKGQA